MIKKMISILFFIVLVSSCGNSQKPADISLPQGATGNTAIATWTLKIPVQMITKPVQEMSLIELNNAMYAMSGGIDLKEKIQTLSQSWASVENQGKAIFLKSFVGDYENALRDRNNLCSIDITWCKKGELRIVSYRPTDLQSNMISWVNMYVDGDVYWTLKWTNDLKVYTSFVHRIKLTKKWYLDFYQKFSLSEGPLFAESINPKMLKATSFISTSASTGVIEKTSHYTFQIEPNSFSSFDGKMLTWNIDIYFFDIDGSQTDLNILNLDAFQEETLSYEGWSMVTHGMPLVKAYQGNEELKIVKPIIWKWKILYTNKMPWIDLEAVPKGVFLWKQELAQYHIPSFWVLNQQSGVWVSSKMKIVDTEWNIEFELK